MRDHDEDLTVAVAADQADWLSDEIAIDFPSIDPLVDRMQASFFGPVVDPNLSAEIVLSPQEAFFGAVVPLDVPVRGICSACGGRGERWADVCDRCAGTGGAIVPRRVRLTVPPRQRDGATFKVSVAPASAAMTIAVRITIA